MRQASKTISLVRCVPHHDVRSILQRHNYFSSNRAGNQTDMMPDREIIGWLSQSSYAAVCLQPVGRIKSNELQSIHNLGSLWQCEGRFEFDFSAQKPALGLLASLSSPASWSWKFRPVRPDRLARTWWRRHCHFNCRREPARAGSARH